MKCFMLSPKIRTSAATLALFLGGFFSSLRGATVEVNPSMSSGTILGIVAALKPGDICVWRGGTYVFELMNAIPGGTSSAWITLRAYSGEKPIIRPSSGAARCITIIGAVRSYIEIDGFICDATNVSYDGIKVTTQTDPTQSSHHIRVRNSEIKNAYGNGILASKGANFCEFLSNYIHHNGHSKQEHGLYHEGSNSLIEKNKFHDNYAAGVHVYSNYGGVDNNIIRGNLSYHNWNPSSPTPTSNTDMIIMSGRGNKVYDNDVSDNPIAGIRVDGASATEVFNNVVQNIPASGVGLDLGAGASGTIVKGNTVCNSPVPYSNRGTGTVDGGGNKFGGVCGSLSPPPPPTSVEVTHNPPISQPSGPSTSQVALPFLIAGVIGAALILGSD